MVLKSGVQEGLCLVNAMQSLEIMPCSYMCKIIIHDDEEPQLAQMKDMSQKREM